VVVFGCARIELQRVIECMDAVVAVAVVAVVGAMPHCLNRRGSTRRSSCFFRSRIYSGVVVTSGTNIAKSAMESQTRPYSEQRRPLFIQNCGFRNSDFGSQPHCIVLYCIAFHSKNRITRRSPPRYLALDGRCRSRAGPVCDRRRHLE